MSFTVTVAACTRRHCVNVEPSRPRVCGGLDVTQSGSHRSVWTSSVASEQLHCKQSLMNYSTTDARLLPSYQDLVTQFSSNCWNGENKARLWVGWTDESFYRGKKMWRTAHFCKAVYVTAHSAVPHESPCYSITSLLALCGFWHFCPRRENNLFGFLYDPRRQPLTKNQTKRPKKGPVLTLPKCGFKK